MDWVCPVTATTSPNNQSSLITNTPGTYIVMVKDVSNSCVTTATIEVWACVGIAENRSQSAVKVFPNPGSGVFEMELENQSTISNVEVYSVSGYLITKVEGSADGTTRIDLSDQTTGIYLLKVSTENRTYFAKLIKE
jgi:hypothetical protein